MKNWLNAVALIVLCAVGASATGGNVVGTKTGNSQGGTANVLAKYQSNGQIGNGGVTDTGTNVTTLENVGVGTASPATPLDVNGASQFGSGATKSTFTATGQLDLSQGVGGAGAILGGTKVSSVTSCGTGAALPAGSGLAGKVTAGSNAVATCCITWSPAYPIGSVCFWQNVTRNMTWSTVAAGAASSTITFTGAWTAGDIIQYNCTGY